MGTTNISSLLTHASTFAGISLPLKKTLNFARSLCISLTAVWLGNSAATCEELSCLEPPLGPQTSPLFFPPPILILPGPQGTGIGNKSLGPTVKIEAQVHNSAGPPPRQDSGTVWAAASSEKLRAIAAYLTGSVRELAEITRVKAASRAPGLN